MSNKNSKSTACMCGNRNTNNRNHKIIDRYYENNVMLEMGKCNIACVRKT